MIVHRHWRRWLVIAGLAVASLARGESLSPEATVTRYLTALKAGKFAEAYDCVSKAMAQNKPREDWAREQQWLAQTTEAKIFDFKVYPAKIEGEKAFVPDLLSSQDKYLNQLGVEEHELYTLIREDGQWKINQQQDVENSNVPKWFPPATKTQESATP